MVLSNTAVPIEYGSFRESVLRGEIPVNIPVSLEMNRIDALIENPDYYYDDEAIEGFIRFCEDEMTLTDGGDLTLLPTFKLWAEQALAVAIYMGGGPVAMYAANAVAAFNEFTPSVPA